MSTHPSPTRSAGTTALILTAALATVGLLGAPSASATTGAGRRHGARSQSTARPPKPLLTIEEQAEDIIDRVPGKRWARIAEDVATIKASWAAYQARAKADGITSAQLDGFDAALDRLAVAAKAKRGPDTLQAANDLSGATVDVFASYDLGHPVPIARLDIIGRQILLDVDRHASDAVQTQIEAARGQWEAIRGEVTARSAAVGAQVDATLAALDEANASGNTGLLKAEVRVLLEAVDAMEELY